MSRFGNMALVFSVESYGAEAKRFVRSSGHYLGKEDPGGYFAVCGRVDRPSDLLPDTRVSGAIAAIAVFGRPKARRLPQDGSWIENTRTAILDGPPKGTASELLRRGWAEAAKRGAVKGLAYHARAKHTGCCYRKAGMHKAGTVNPPAHGWSSRKGRTSAEQTGEPKRRWLIDLTKMVEYCPAEHAPRQRKIEGVLI